MFNNVTKFNDTRTARPRERGEESVWVAYRRQNGDEDAAKVMSNKDLLYN